MMIRGRAAAVIPVFMISTALLSCGKAPSGLGSGGVPTPSQLTIQLDGQGDSTGVSARWTECPDDDFAMYVLHRSLVPGIQQDPSQASAVAIVTNPLETEFTDWDPEPGETSYYCLRTVNEADYSSWSNEESISVPDGWPPAPSVLQAHSTGASVAIISLSWTQCPDGDFCSYSLFRSGQPGIAGDTSAAENIALITVVDQTGINDGCFPPGSLLYYALRTSDTSGLSSWSNEIGITVPEGAPMLTVFFIDPSYGSYSGDAILVCTPGGYRYLIDGGDRDLPGWDCGAQRVIPLLDSLGIRFLDGMVASHPHADHVGGLITVLQEIPTRSVWDCGWTGSSSWIYEKFLDAVYESGADYSVARRGDLLEWDEIMTTEVFHPVDPLDQFSMNSMSIVIRITFGNRAFLFTGDLESSDGESSVLAAVSDLSADVLKVGHHGSDDATGWNWLSAVNPSIGAIEVGSGNPYGHPHPALLSRLASYGADVHRTDSDGSFAIATDGTTLTVYP